MQGSCSLTHAPLIYCWLRLASRASVQSLPHSLSIPTPRSTRVGTFADSVKYLDNSIAKLSYIRQRQDSSHSSTALFGASIVNMGKKSEEKLSSLLHHRLKTALHDGIKVWFETRDKSYFGIPIGLDPDFVEVLILVPGSDDESSEYIFQRVTWVVRLASISAIAYPSEYWSADRLDSLLNKSDISQV